MKLQNNQTNLFSRYALLNHDVVCFCSNHIGSEYSSDRCTIKCVSCPQAASLSDVYETGIKGNIAK